MIGVAPNKDQIKIRDHWMRRINYNTPLDPCMVMDHPVWEKIPEGRQTEASMMLESAKPFTSKHSIYVEVRVKIRRYHRYTLNRHVDTGAGFNMMLKNALPEHMLKKSPLPQSGYGKY